MSVDDNKVDNKIAISNKDVDVEKDIKKVGNTEDDGKKCTKCPVLKKTTIGGQALIEGIMMCGPKNTSMAVRKLDGTIHIEEVKQSENVIFLEKLPFVRGCIKFYKMLVTGTRALMRSAELSEEGAEEIDKADVDKNGAEDKEKSDKTESKSDSKEDGKFAKFMDSHTELIITLSAIVGILLSVGLFILFPRLVIDVLARVTNIRNKDGIRWSLLMNLLEGFLRVGIFILYLFFASKIKDVARVWQYHGAEHKTIACYEAGEQLTVDNIMKFPRFHPRCGTAFMFIVLFISVIIYTIMGAITGDKNMLFNLLSRIILLPIVCGISYEILRFVGRYDEKKICKFLCKPGLWLQNFTTKEPDAPIIEVAICAMQAVIPENSNDDVW